MSDTTAKIRAKGCEATGLTEELARKLWDAGAGERLMAIVELKVMTPHGPDTEGKRAVDLVIEALEPVVDGNLNGKLDEHVRTIQAALYRNRALADGQQELDYEGDGPEPTVAEVLAHGESLIEHDEDGNAGLWDGTTDADEDVEPDDEDHQDQDQEPDADDPAYEPHAYIDTAHATCGHMGCGQPAGAAIHTTADQPEPVA